MKQIEEEVTQRLLDAFLKGRLQVGEAGGAVGGEHDDLAIKDEAFGGEPGHLRREGFHAVGPIEAGAGEELDFASILAGLDAVAIQLELVEPTFAVGRSSGWRGQLRRDEFGQLFFGGSF